MIILSVSKFSCIDEAEIQLGDLTILIGPQASGKSVLSKLIYFCYNIMLQQHFRAIEEEKTLDEFKESVASRFQEMVSSFCLGHWKVCDSVCRRPIRNQDRQGIDTLSNASN